MHTFFYPESAVVIGVSPSPTNLGRNIATNLTNHGYAGRLYLVGRSGGELFDLPILPRVEDLPEAVETAVIITPAATIPEIVEACGRRGIKRIIIESGGFGEYAPSRRSLEAEIISLIEKHSLRLIGPNCVGVANMDNGFVVPFPRVTETPKRVGSVSIIAQSGGVGLAYLNTFIAEGLGINKFCSVGNKLNVDEADLLEYLIGDEASRVICLYLESISRGRELIELAAGTDKPILIHKSNTSPSSARIAASHTTALSSDEAVVEAAFKQVGIIRVRSVREMIDRAKLLTLPLLKGPRLGVVSRSGGFAVMAADACAEQGLETPPLPPQLLDEIESHFRGGVIKIQNPIDLGDLFDFSVYISVAESILALGEIDGLLFLHGYRGAEAPDSRRFIEALAQMAPKYSKPVALSLLAEDTELAHVRQSYHFPVFTESAAAIDALAASYQAFRKASRPREEAGPHFEMDRPAIEALLARERLSLADGLRLAEAAGIKTAPGREAYNRKEVLAAAEELGGLVALKAGNPAVSHKSDVGGIVLDLAGPEATAAGLDKLAANLDRAGLPEPWPVFVQGMISGGLEVILGGRQDPTFGPIILAGLGGVLVEVLADGAIRTVPCRRAEVLAMLDQLKGAPILDGVRGRVGADKEALVEALLRLAQLLEEYPRIREIDLNPVAALPPGAGLLALDARVVVGVVGEVEP